MFQLLELIAKSQLPSLSGVAQKNYMNILERVVQKGESAYELPTPPPRPPQLPLSLLLTLSLVLTLCLTNIHSDKVLDSQVLLWKGHFHNYLQWKE